METTWMIWSIAATATALANGYIAWQCYRRLKRERQMRRPPRFRKSHPDTIIEPEATVHSRHPARRARVTKAVMTQRRVD